jgi:hypothetical protein
MKTWQLVLSIILFQFTWISAAFLYEWLAVIGLLCLGLALRFSPANGKQILVGGVFAAALGVFMDIILTYFDIYRFLHSEYLTYTYIPIWLFIMWIAFATSLFSSLYWALNKPIIFTALCALLGPTSYLVGRNIGIIDFDNDSGFIMMIGWSIWASIFLGLWHTFIKHSSMNSLKRDE